MKSTKLFPSAISWSYHLRNAVSSQLQKLSAAENVIVQTRQTFDDGSEKKESHVIAGGKTNYDQTSIVKENVILDKDQGAQSSSSSLSPPASSSSSFESVITERIDTKNDSNGLSEEVQPSPHPQPPSAPFISTTPSLTKSAIESRTRHLVRSLSLSSPSNSRQGTSSSSTSTSKRIQELCKHLSAYPQANGLAIQEGVISQLLKLREWSDERVIKAHSRQALSLLGYSDPPKGRGIRILSIDGGGTRGIAIIEMLRHFETLTGKPSHQMFDLICGVSTGGIITMLLGALQTPINDCETYYRKFSANLFKSDFWRGAGRLIWSHSYYDTQAWEKILRDMYNETALIETAQHQEIPKVVTISAIMNLPSIQAYLFRNYNPPNIGQSQYEGSCSHKVWQAVRASAAAPGYFEEFTLDKYVHQDGGILINNPTAIAIHEAKALWPNEEIQTVLSLGSGRFVPPLNISDLTIKEQAKQQQLSTSLKTKIARFIDSATDTEMVHRLMQDFLPSSTYFRLNPVLREVSTLDEAREEKLEQLKEDAQMYLRKNEYKVKQAIKSMSAKRSAMQSANDWAKLQYQLRF